MELRTSLVDRCLTYDTVFDALAERPEIFHLREGVGQVWNRGPLLCVRVVGHAEQPVADVFAARANETIARYGRVITFHDWSAVDGYDRASKEALLAWTREAGAQNPSVHMLFRSRLISMAVAVASIALRNLHGFNDPRRFLDRFEQVIAEEAPSTEALTRRSPRA